MALVFLFSTAGLVIALWMQVAKEWYPCPLCIMQRYVFLLAAVFSLLYLVKPSRWFLGLAALSSVAGMGVGLYHQWVLASPGQTCGVDPLQVLLNDLPWVGLYPTLFEANGLCSDVYPPWFGLSIPMWGLVGAAVLFVLSVLVLIRPASR